MHRWKSAHTSFKRKEDMGNNMRMLNYSAGKLAFEQLHLIGIAFSKTGSLATPARLP